MKTHLNIIKTQNIINQKVILTFLLATSVALNAQDYDINFTGFGDSTVIDSIKVENLTQETTLTLDGSDILNLVGTLSIDDLNENEVDVKIYPNPIRETGRLALYSNQADDVEINIFDLSGKLISTHTDKVYPGKNTYEISNYPSGMYIANISTNSWQKSLKFISQGSGQKSPEIKTESRKQSQNIADFQFKSSSNIVQMQYNDGDQLLLQAFAEANITYFTLVPIQSQAVNFEFVACEDADGNHYPVVTIGTQTWMAKNLNVSTTSGSWCYDDDPANCDTYGRLYDWNTLMDGAASSIANPSGVQGLCPQGWHLPSDPEWTQLTDFLGGEDVAGSKMESTTGWSASNTGATNSSGFSGLPGGYRTPPSNYYLVGSRTNWWSSSENNSAASAWSAWYLRMDGSGSVYNVYMSYDDKTFGFSCRCLRD